MAIPDELLYEYAVIRYVPRVDREEFINIGLIMMSKRNRWLRGAVRLSEWRIHALDPDANLGELKRQAAIFMRNDLPSEQMPVEERYRWLTAVKSAVLQVSPSHPGLLVGQEEEGSDREGRIERLDREFDRLLGRLVL